MKKKNLKNLKLNKRSISNLEKRNVFGGQVGSISLVPCWSILSCPTMRCTDGCDISVPMTDCFSMPVIFHTCRPDIEDA